MHAVSNLLNGLDSNTIDDVCETDKYIFAAGEGAAPPPPFPRTLAVASASKERSVAKLWRYVETSALINHRTASGEIEESIKHDHVTPAKMPTDRPSPRPTEGAGGDG